MGWRAGNDALPMSRLTLRELAKLAGVHVTTASQALRGTGRIAPATRERVQKLAKELGYVPDPALSALASYRQRIRPVHFQAVLGFLNNFPTREAYHEVPVYHSYFEGACERAAELGYKLEEFWLREAHHTTARTAQMLTARGINGVLFAPQPQSELTVAWPWGAFASVTFGFSLATPALHRVTNDQFGTMSMLVQQAAALGYRRIGWATCELDEARVRWVWSASFNSEISRHPECVAVQTLCPVDPIKTEQLVDWVRREHPDLVITGHAGHVDVLRQAGWRVPEDIGVMLTSLPEMDTAISGAYQNDRRIGGSAVEKVVAMLQRNERGEPACPVRIHVPSEWRAGTTAPRRRPR